VELTLSTGLVCPIAPVGPNRVAFAVWSPDGRRLAFSSFPNHPRRAKGSPVVVVVDRDGSHRRIVAANGELVVHWSPDGSRLAYTRATSARTWSLWVVRPDGRNLHLAVRPLLAPDFSWRRTGAGSHSPDGGFAGKQ
jgi:Tol biopolymer transport system component